jgi:hypothetical protein
MEDSVPNTDSDFPLPHHDQTHAGVNPTTYPGLKSHQIKLIPDHHLMPRLKCVELFLHSAYVLME